MTTRIATMLPPAGPYSAKVIGPEIDMPECALRTGRSKLCHTCLVADSLPEVHDLVNRVENAGHDKIVCA